MSPTCVSETLPTMETRMLRIALCGHIPVIADDARSVIERCAHEAGADNVELLEFAHPLDLVDAVSPAKAQAGIDAVICGLDTTGMTSIEFARELRHEDFDGHIIMIAEDSEDAAEAFEMHVCGYFVDEASADDLSEVLGRVLRDAMASHRSCIDLRTRDGFRRIRLSQLLYSETDDHDQKLHLADGSTVNVRMSSSAFFEMLEESGRFFKAGSSFIVNLGCVRSVNAKQSSATLADGTEIPIPGRVRKSLEEAILTDG